MRVGYARVSTDDQSVDVQLEALKAAGCEKVFADQVSGKNIEDRPELKRMIEFVREGDEVYVTKLDRLSRNTLDMLTLIQDIGTKGCGFKSMAEPWCDTTTAAGRLMLVVFSGVAQFDRERIRERQREGIEHAKQKGVYRGAVVRFDPHRIRDMRAEGIGPAEIARQLNCSEMTVFRALRDTA